MLEIMILVSSANNIGFDIEFIHGGRSFIYIMAQELIVSDLHICLPQSEKIFLVVLGDFTSTSCLLLVE
jgi:hypothetical protein